MKFFQLIAPNVAEKADVFGKAILETLLMAAWAGVFIILFGLILGIILVITGDKGIRPNKAVYQVLDKIINLFRSIPFVILLAGLMPLSRLIMGTAIGLKGAIVPLVIGAIPFYSRQVESALSQVDRGQVEAAEAFGCGVPGIIFRVYLKESIAPLARGTTIAIISLFGLIAMAGAVGAGGLGDFAIRYGHDRNQTDATLVTVLVLVIMVSIIQIIGNTVAKKNTH